MSTRGFLGFVAEGHETITYVHFDAYPSGLGADVLRFARSVTDWDAVKRQAAAIVHIDADVPPTPEQCTALERFADHEVGGKDPSPDAEWYRLLRHTQGDPAALLEAGHAAHDPAWPGDSLFCEWGYLLDLDAGVLEVYGGFQKRPHTGGRFSDRKCRDGYHPVRRVASWLLTELPDDAALDALES